MKNKQKIIILITGFVCGIIIAGLFVFIFPASKNEGVKQEQDTTQAASKNKKEISNLKLQLQGAEDALQNAKTGKNNQNVADLETLAQSLFKVYYNYDQSKTTNSERQKEVSDWVIPEVSQKLFPLSADKVTSDYGTIQSQLNSLQVYAQPQAGTNITAFIDCDYTVSAGDLKSNVPHYIFEVTYDVSARKITAVTELGKVGK
ncbi:hypothetical protein P7H79_02180 [Lactococcus lactis]|uniref:hypothetical protein n=1 Tax=Lactococcus lactis TaxID=1358 RepID=UPI0028915447|nr:hypothetical protein [Lactococcus lactis]MDT2872191.1 hypothetical protein [Lactococcus lactis]MDT2933760.1 hypothetical protein [Lactococcus lactis]